MARYNRFVEELLDFLLIRLDETGFARLVVHEPKRMSAAYFEGGGGRAETRGATFTGCATCSQIPPGSLFASYVHINVEEWPCLHVRSLALPFAGDPDYRDGWRPDHAVFASGKLVHQDDDCQWPHQLPLP
ncbi:hypothetical protein [Actinomadura alba]|uniref:Uncharacterized protein n=1 Tax=Actinomadura alba TaxID=406431 RepID=A0ABR7LWJ9_9ACTN|nr:hypothetical protein [Actinomadura alba]MBC6468959.1 hypothetical protein [Actinomadura alba]